ncbi:helix-turn-helix domain-containing protein [Intrasporangium sp.]|uniref:winged helix-turn-helix transcriptional regulator n=1 Tax=Intrasporangium sp. TaxID=1925024 RepID=UPI00293AD393|nr:helix-turn-helix domain-containing protein [Intrasporangium sp.]MDV3222239.1 helix-turn-helix transcriptional regulator [Intrasporangium sp.]
MVVQDETCGVNIAFSVVGSKWKPTIVWVLSQGARRFAELRREVGPVSEKVLASQLRELQRDGIVSRAERGGFPLHVEYSLTERGVALNEALEPVAEWAHRHGEHLVTARSYSTV